MNSTRHPSKGRGERATDQRRTRRVHDLKPTRVELKGRLLPVSDISSDGIGVVIDPAGPSFFPGERLEAVGLPLQSGTVTVKGVVSHISETAAATICGIRFIFEGDEFEAVRRFKTERMQPAHTRTKSQPKIS